MLITLSVNELFKDVILNKTFRVLWIDEGNIIAYVIDIDDKRALPFTLTIKNIVQNILDDTFKFATRKLVEYLKMSKY